MNKRIKPIIEKWINDTEKKMTPTEYNRQGNPVSIIECVKNSTTNQLLKELKIIINGGPL